MRTHLSAAAVIALIGFGAVPTGTPVTSKADASSVQSNRTDEEEKRRARLTLSTSTARVLGDVFNFINEEPPRYQEALNELNRLLGRDLSEYDESTALELRAGVYAATENYPAALRDYVRILEIDELPFDRLKQIRYYVAQLYFQEGNYAQTVNFMRQYLAEEANVTDSNAWFILAGAYVQQDNYNAARDPAEKALQYDEKKEKKSYELLNLVYSELGLSEPRARLLEEMIQRFPNEESYWSQLAGIYSNLGREKDAFAVLLNAYNAGLIEDEQKIVALAQYYSSLDNPFHGAQLLEAEMNAGTVERDLDNLTLLAQLWSMAREQERAIETLTAAARLSGSGDLYYRLGQSYMASEEYTLAIRNLNEALNRGGLSASDRGDIYLLLGNAYFNTDPDSVQGRNNARRAFRSALDYSNSRSAAQGWIGYVNAYENTLRRQDEVERLQRLERLRRERERCVGLVDLADLGGSVDRDSLEECRTLIANTDEEGLPLSDDEAEDGDDAPAESDDAANEAEGEE